MIEILQSGDSQYFSKWGVDYLIGIDEAGRGCLAGPVVAGAVAVSAEILKQSYWAENPYSYIRDSKKVTSLRREKIAVACERLNLIQGLGVISNALIDQLNILEATKLAWEKALNQCLEALPLEAKLGVLIDGNMSPKNLDYPCRTIVKGDDRHLSIALASIYAKVTRDKLMIDYDSQYPIYQFNQHKGYGTAKHIRAIAEYGLSPIHRKTFCLQFLKKV